MQLYCFDPSGQFRQVSADVDVGQLTTSAGRPTNADVDNF